MTDITYLPNTSFAQLCAAVGHGVYLVYADGNGNLYGLGPYPEVMAHQAV